MAGTVEARVTSEKTDMCMVCNTYTEECTWCENHAREAFCCFLVRKTWEMEIMIMMRGVS